MAKLPACTPKRVLRALERAGFFVHHISGSHYILKHANHPERRITLPMHNRDLKRRTLESIIEQSGLTKDEFVKFL